MTNKASQELKYLLLNVMVANNYSVPKDDIPNSWEKYGDLILFRDKFFKNPIWYDSADVAWKTICDTFSVQRIGLKSAICDDNFRSPRIKIIYGESGWIEMKDNGIIYSWDCQKSMFCRGNLSERHRIAKLNCHDEIIVDLFAGIGYFTLPYLVHAKAAHVHACEWNPHAVSALRRNLALNSVADRCTIHDGDNRKAGLYNIGARINVGIIPSSQDFWKTACSALISSGGILYIHENVTSVIPAKAEDICDSCTSLLKDKTSSDKYVSAICVKRIDNVVDGSDLITSMIPEYKVKWKKAEWFNFSIHLSHCILNLLQEVHKSISWTVSVREYFKVKSYAPHIDHLVFAVYCFPE